jgi:hypothetical protein
MYKIRIFPHRLSDCQLLFYCVAWIIVPHPPLVPVIFISDFALRSIRWLDCAFSERLVHLRRLTDGGCRLRTSRTNCDRDGGCSLVPHIVDTHRNWCPVMCKSAEEIFETELLQCVSGAKGDRTGRYWILLLLRIQEILSSELQLKIDDSKRQYSVAIVWSCVWKCLKVGHRRFLPHPAMNYSVIISALATT